MLTRKQVAGTRVTSLIERVSSFAVLREQDGKVYSGDAVPVSIDSSVTNTLTELPAEMSDVIEAQLIDDQLLTRLASSKTINWCRTVVPMYPLRTTNLTERISGPRDSLLVAITTAVWGSADAGLVDLVRRLAHVAMTQTRAVKFAERVDKVIDEPDAALVNCSSPGVVSVSSAQWQRLGRVFSDDADLASTSSDIRPIHVFVLCHVFRRPILVVSARTDGAQSLSGIYLPLLHEPSTCCTSPLAIVHLGQQFSPLVPRARTGRDAEHGMALCRADTDETLVVRCLLGSECADTVLETYLRVVQLPHTSSTGTRLFPVAKYDVVAPGCDLVDEFLASSSAPLGTAAATSVSVDQPECRPCPTVGCQFYGLQQHNWKCSRCYDNGATSSQSTSSSEGHVLHMTSALKVAALPAEHELTRPVTRSKLVTGAVICSVPSCNEPIAADNDMRCAQHAVLLSAARSHHATCMIAGCSAPAGDKYAGLCAKCYVAGATATETLYQVRGTTTCIMDFCSNIGSADCKGLCQQCFTVLCQSRLQTADDRRMLPPVSTGSYTNVVSGGGSTVRSTVKCMMEGCRTMVAPDAEVCDECRRKQLEAYEDEDNRVAFGGQIDHVHLLILRTSETQHTL